MKLNVIFFWYLMIPVRSLFRNRVLHPTLYHAASISSDILKSPRLYVDLPTLLIEGDYILNDDTSHYVAKVMRKNVGDVIRIFNGYVTFFLNDYKFLIYKFFNYIYIHIF